MIVVDVETTGVVPHKHSIVAIGALDPEKPEWRFYKECRIWEGAHVSDESLEINGFTLEQITDPAKETEGEVARAFLEWSQHMGDRTLAGQNVSFDRDFLRLACMREGLSWDLAHRTIDTHTLCFMHMIKRGVVPPIDPEHRRSALNLDAILIYCGIAEEPKPHNALTGALSHAEVIWRLLYGKPLLPEFSEYPLPW